MQHSYTWTDIVSKESSFMHCLFSTTYLSFQQLLPLCSKSLRNTYCCHLCSTSWAALKFAYSSPWSAHLWLMIERFWSCSISHYTCGISICLWKKALVKRCSFSSLPTSSSRETTTDPGLTIQIRCFLYCVLWHDLANNFSCCTVCV